MEDLFLFIHDTLFFRINNEIETGFSENICLQDNDINDISSAIQ